MIVERVTTPRGELVLRRDGEHFEVISNGAFLMDTRNGESERLLVSLALERAPAAQTMLIGGLGVGFSLIEALRSAQLTSVTVVEIERVLLDWHRSHLAALTEGALADPRASIRVEDLLVHLQTTDARYDAICLDIDNGPEWTVTEANASLYDDAGTSLVASRLADGGVLTVWAAADSSSYRTTLRRHFGHVEVHEVAVQRGEPDVVVLATNAFASSPQAPT